MAHWGAGGTGYANEGSEWNDVLIKKGIKEDDRERKEVKAWISEEDVNAQRKEKQLQTASLDELDALEDDEEDAVLAIYREKRLAELKQAAMVKAKMSHGLPEISKNQWTAEVTDASKDGKVVVLLFKPGEEWCALLERRLVEVASRFPRVKFIKIVFTTAIPNFPEQNLPTLLVYDRDEPIQKIMGVTAYGGGSKMTADDVEWALHVRGIVKSEMEENPRSN